MDDTTTCDINTLSDEANAALHVQLDRIIAMHGGLSFRQENPRALNGFSDADRKGLAAMALLKDPELKETLSAAKQLMKAFHGHDIPLNCFHQVLQSKAGLLI